MSSPSSLLRYCGHMTASGPTATGYFIPRLLHHCHALRRRLRLHRPHCSVKESHDGLRTNGNRVILSCDVSISIMLYRGGCAFIVLIAQILWSRDSLRTNWEQVILYHCISSIEPLWKRLCLHRSHCSGIAVT